MAATESQMLAVCSSSLWQKLSEACRLQMELIWGQSFANEKSKMKTEAPTTFKLHFLR